MFNIYSLWCCCCKLQILLMVARDFLQLHNWRETRTNGVTDMQHCSSGESRVNDLTGAQTLNLISGAIKLHAFVFILRRGVCVIHCAGHGEERRSRIMKANTEEERTKNRNEQQACSKKYILSVQLW